MLKKVEVAMEPGLCVPYGCKLSASADASGDFVSGMAAPFEGGTIEVGAVTDLFLA